MHEAARQGSTQAVSAQQDSALVRRAQAGDQRAFTLLVERHRDRAWTLARGIVRDPHDAEDVVQESFIAALRHLDQFRQGAAFSTWLHRIVVRRSYDHLRRRVPTPMDPQEGMVTGLAAGVDVHAQQLVRSDLLDAIAGLDEGFREAVLLVDVHGVSVEEAAATLGVAPGTVKSRVFRGRAALAIRLGTQGHSGASES